MKKVSKKNYVANSVKIIPKEYIGYVLITTPLCLFMVPEIIYIIVDILKRWNEFSLADNILILTFLFCSFTIMVYVLISLIKIWVGKIYIEISDGDLIYNGVLSRKHMYINNIITIQRVSGFKQLTSIIILRKPDKINNQSKIIKFPLAWFADNDINYFLEYLRKNNKKIEWKGF